jgi:hypothetical protein
VNEPLQVVESLAGTQIVAGAAVLVLALAGCLVMLRVMLRRTRRDLAQTQRAAAELRSRVDGLAEQVRAQAATPEPGVAGETEYLITVVGADPEQELLPERIEGRLFADIVLREAVVRAASLTHGVRRALAPETRNRIRFEMRREVKRSRKQRRADLKAARRDWEARQRDGLRDEDAA